jgi:hypothetical protein
MADRRRLLAALACAGTAAVFSSQVIAGADGPGVTFASHTAPLIGGIAVHEVRAGQGVIIGTNTEDVAFNCTAVTQGVVASTGVMQCYLLGADGFPYATTAPVWLPGNVAEVTKVASGLPVQGYKLCMQAGYVTTSGGLTSGSPDCVNPV